MLLFSSDWREERMGTSFHLPRQLRSARRARSSWILFHRGVHHSDENRENSPACVLTRGERLEPCRICPRHEIQLEEEVFAEELMEWSLESHWPFPDSCFDYEKRIVHYQVKELPNQHSRDQVQRHRECHRLVVYVREKRRFGSNGLLVGIRIEWHCLVWQVL